ncbi:hydroxyacylglutathione hydrolase [Denitratisoma sp. DHT3]|uniref:hydroxyacylglutathione hydrolase n=1 Tax=Denitratisoma sp. DHT3 TaxID=1981880 RepID=UPI0011983C0D|nr:hydroxyacylglutathione hydrolase [Denitratisoma sp. DHT3]QDX80386.1 hydroxyacylglutathione hydrolase [Denitratisoma sp. DHT3]
MDIVRLRAFSDNYIWLLRHGGHVAAVDPGDAQPVIDHLAQSGDRLGAILLTHHHPDHTGGVAELVRRHPVPVFGPAAEDIPGVTHALSGGERIELPFPAAPLALEALDVAGHTRGHLAYRYFGDTAERGDYRRNILFCGDTLFTLGCGRLFEGSAEQMHRALQRLAALPGDTLVYCAHEYCHYNLPFALAVEPRNPALLRRAEELRRLLAAGQATVPMRLEDELATNPFLRCHLPAVIDAASAHVQRHLTGATEVFAVLREWRNDFKAA